MKTIGFFNNKGGVGKTTLVYHVAWMMAEMGLSVLAADFDPQANLTSTFLDDERLEEVWADSAALTVAAAVRPLVEREGDVAAPLVERVGDRIGVLLGDLGLSRFEDLLSQNWPFCLEGNVGAFRVTRAFAQLVRLGSQKLVADIALVDVGPNFGAINRAALLACDYIVMPLGADLYSLQALRNVGPTLQEWRRDWQDRLHRKGATAFDLPPGTMKPLGYVVLRHSVRLDRPARAFSRWTAKLPGQYAASVMNQADASVTVENDPNCLRLIKDYRSLMPLAQEARKPMFLLKPADGAFGGHQQAVQDCYKDFKALTLSILDRCGVRSQLVR